MTPTQTSEEDIKFKVWDKGTALYAPRMISFEEVLKTLTLTTLFGDKKSDRYKVLLSTGLFDKNGIEIYVGDVLKVASNGYSNYISFRGAYCYVEYDEDRCCFRATTGNGYDTNNAFQLNCDAEIKVIGNFYENKELLND